MTAPLDTARLELPSGFRHRLRSLGRQFRPENRTRVARLPRAELTLAREGRRAAARVASGEDVGTTRLSAILVINLASRQDRLNAFMHDAERLRLPHVRRLDAIAHENGSVGCALSHATCMEQMLAEGWQAMMVCEDDAVFRVGRARLDALVERFLDDATAEAACLAYFHRDASPHDSLYLRTVDTQTAACYLIKNSLAAEMLEVSRHAAEELARGGAVGVYSLDQVWKKLQRTHVFLIPIVRAVTQRPSYSDIALQAVHYRV